MNIGHYGKKITIQNAMYIYIILIFEVYIVGKYKNILPTQFVKVHWVGERQRIEWKEFSVCMVWSDYTVCLIVLKKLFSSDVRSNGKSVILPYISLVPRPSHTSVCC